MNDLVSVIVPIYNKEYLIGRCVESLIKQTYTNIEIILVDDGSTDKSLEICQDFQKKDSRIKVYHKDNGGLSDARNYGLAHASGAWIAFVDGDDYVENDYIEILLRNSNDVDLVVCNCYQLTENKRIISKHVFGNRLFVGNDTIYSDIIIPMITLNNNKTNMLYPAWNKLYRKQIINDNYLKFDTNLPYAEDYMFCIQFFKAISGVRFIECTLYNYDCTIQNSLSKVPISTDKLEKYNYVHARVAELFPEKGREVFPTSVLYDCKHHIRLYARLNGFDGFKSFCNDVYNMAAFKDAATFNPPKGNWWHFGLPASLRRKNHHSLFLCWAYLFSSKGFLKYYVKKFI